MKSSCLNIDLEDLTALSQNRQYITAKRTLTELDSGPAKAKSECLEELSFLIVKNNNLVLIPYN